MDTGLRVGVDIGGTFTDIVILKPGDQLDRIKILTNHRNYAESITGALQSALSDTERGSINAFAHGTTVATNAILEHKAQKLALITTAGFKDVLTLRRGRRPYLYALDWEPPVPLVERHLRLEVIERIDGQGQIVMPLDDRSVQECVEILRTEKTEALAICLLNAFANPTHELELAKQILTALPNLKITCSSTISPEPKEFERTSTTLVNAFLLPVVRDYLANLEIALRGSKIDAAPQVMQSDGTMAGASLVRERPFMIIESGPAAGVVASARLAEELDHRAVIAFDMGGTTAKATLIEDFRVVLTDELEVGASISRSGGNVRGSGYVVHSPCVDLTEVGSGGGSIAWLDGGGILRVGPMSTGSDPGPACYGQGGTEATVTDAHVVLGFLNPNAIAGGKKAIHPDLALKAVEKLAKALNVSVQAAAYGIFSVATAGMRRAVRAVSVERGRDPRDFTLYSFGGAGGLHAAALADDMEMERVVVPIAPGLFSSLGLLLSDIAVTRISSRHAVLNVESVAALIGDVTQLASEARIELQEHYGASQDIICVDAAIGMQYVGQASPLLITLPDGGAPDAIATFLAQSFHREHRRVHGQAAESEPVEMTSIRVRAILPAPPIKFSDLAHGIINRGDAAAAAHRTRTIYFGPKRGTHDTPILARNQLLQNATKGPLVIEEPESTILIPPGFSASLHPSGSIVITPDGL